MYAAGECTDDFMRNIELFQICNFLRGELHVHTPDCGLDPVRISKTYDRRSDHRLGQQPCKRNLNHGDTAFSCNLLDAINDRLIHIFRCSILDLYFEIIHGAVVRLIPGVRTFAGSQRAVRRGSHARVETGFQHLTLSSSR